MVGLVLPLAEMAMEGRLDISGHGRKANASTLSSLMVGAIGFESTVKRSFNNMQVGGRHARLRKAVEDTQAERG